jgi:hypothetical protein
MQREPKTWSKMKTFQHYISLKESDASDTASGGDSDKAHDAAMQAFEIVLTKNSKAATRFLNDIAEVIPEIKTILQQHGLDSFKSFDSEDRSKRNKSRRIVSKGLADVSPDDVKNHGTDVIATNSADSYHNPIG